MVHAELLAEWGKAVLRQTCWKKQGTKRVSKRRHSISSHHLRSKRIIIGSKLLQTAWRFVDKERSPAWNQYWCCDHHPCTRKGQAVFKKGRFPFWFVRWWNTLQISISISLVSGCNVLILKLFLVKSYLCLKCKVLHFHLLKPEKEKVFFCK